MLLIYPHQFLSTSLFSDTKDVIGSSYTFPASILKLAIFPRSPGSCCGRNWALGAGQTDYYRCRTLSVGKTRADMRVYTHLCLYSLHICPWGLKTTITSLTRRVPASFFPFNICNSFSDRERLDCSYSPYFTSWINLFSVTYLPLCCPCPSEVTCADRHRCAVSVTLTIRNTVTAASDVGSQLVTKSQ